MANFLVDGGTEFEFQDDEIVAQLAGRGALLESDDAGAELSGIVEEVDDPDEDVDEVDENDDEEDKYYILNPGFTFTAADVSLLIQNT